MSYILDEEATNKISFLELLLDETVCEGKIYIPKKLVYSVGGINKRLIWKKKYELLLRIAKKISFGFRIVKDEEDISNQNIYIELDDDENKGKTDSWRTDCYLLSKYSVELQESGYFNQATEAILAGVSSEVDIQHVLSYMEIMLKKTKEYYKIDNTTKPILIYKGDAICHNILTVFAEQLGKALVELGENVEYFDLQSEEIAGLLRYTGHQYKAIIGVQSYLFSVKMKDEIHYLHEYIGGKKFNFVFDHPIWFKDHFLHNLENFYALAVDEHYAQFIKKIFHKKAFFFPPAGMGEDQANFFEKKYDVTFVGTLGEYKSKFRWIKEQAKPERFWANRFLLIMRKNPGYTAEEAFEQMLKYYQLDMTDENKKDLFYQMRILIFAVMHYYREKIIRCILQSGIRLDVFGDPWEKSDLAEYPNLICHPDITVEESLQIWSQSKLSMNIMSWHKAGFTERMSSIMLSGAVLVTDDTEYLPGHYTADDMIVFRLENYKELPQKIKMCLENDELRIQMAKNGRDKTLPNHTWIKRAEQFLELLEKLDLEKEE